MNDVMIDYESTIYKTLATNKITKIIDKFTPRHNGGIYNNGFGYQLTNITYTDVKSITIEDLNVPHSSATTIWKADRPTLLSSSLTISKT